MAAQPSENLRAQAYSLYQRGDAAGAQALCIRALEANPADVEAIYLLGVIATDAGNTGEAYEQFQRAAQLAPDNGVIANALGETFLLLGREPEALEQFRRAMAVQPGYARAHNNVGRLLHAKGDLAGAKASFSEALRSNPNYATAHNNLGAVLLAQGDPGAAECFRRALEIQPDYPEAHFNLGSAMQGSRDLAGAIAELQMAVRLRRNYARAQAMLGDLLSQAASFDEACDAYQHAARLNPQSPEAQYAAALSLQDAGQLSRALLLYQDAVRLRPDFPEAHCRMGEVLADLNRISDALGSYQTATRGDVHHTDAFHSTLALLDILGRRAEADDLWRRRLGNCPDDAARIRAVLDTPHIFQWADEMRTQRRRLEDGLLLLEQRSLSIDDPLAQVNATNFFAAYHGVNDREIQTRLAHIYARATPSLSYVAPHCREPICKGSREKLRIGFVSAFFNMHTIGEVNLGLIRNLSRQSCRVILFSLSGPDDAVARLIRQSADQVVELRPSLDAARRQIADQKLDVLFYTDIGMDVFTYFLAFSRLAPVQCTTWGHPDTTGIPTMDYYLSGVDLEPPDADEHYSEKLVRLRGLPTHYFAPAFFPPAKPRSYFGLAEDEHLYLCSQAPFKVHPDYDAMLGEILRADPRARVLFICSHNSMWTHQLRRRLRRSLGREVDRVRFLPHQGGQDYLHLLNVCDVLLDTTHFGGGNTHFKAFSVGTPVVTLPGAFARSRVASACYRRMGIAECVAADVEDCVRIALRLGMDRDWNQHIRARIRDARHVLFEDAGVLREFEQFFVDAIVGVVRATSPSHTDRNALRFLE